jgi:hypothetical protein
MGGEPTTTESDVCATSKSCCGFLKGFGVLAVGVMLVLAVIVGPVLLSQVPAIYYGKFRAIERKLSNQHGVKVVKTWKHEDIDLEDCGFTLQVRSCPLVGIDFYDGRDWLGQFERIDGVAVCPVDGSLAIKLISTESLTEHGLSVHNIPELLSQLEGVLALADAIAANGTWPCRDHRYAIIRFPKN